VLRSTINPPLFKITSSNFLGVYFYYPTQSID